MKLSARNILKGKVIEILEGVITAEVKLDIGNGNIITSLISKEGAKDLALKVGDKVYAVIKSTEVMVAKQE